MNQIVLAQTSLPLAPMQTPAFWAELDAALVRLQGSVQVIDRSTRRYQLTAIDLEVRVADGLASATWMSREVTLDARGRIDLRQMADAWLDTLGALMMPASPVSARVHAASALLAAGFETVAVSSHGLQNGRAAAIRVPLAA